MRGWINLNLRMNKFLLSAIALLACVCVYARDYSIKVDTTSVPSAAQEVLVQRFTQMLEAGGLTVVEEGADVITLTPTVTDRTEVSGQVALTVDLKAAAGEVEEVFPIKGVGENEADAWLRAVKRLLPRSKEAQKFVEELK